MYKNMEKISKAYKGGLRRIIKKSFPIWERLGFHITPNYFYEPIPDTRTLKDGLWLNQSELTGINIDEEIMNNLLSKFYSKFKDEYESFPRTKTSIPYQYYVNNRGFESVDGEIYYCMIRNFKPKRIIEVGAGNSTYLSAQALLKNQEEYGIVADLIAIEPYPNDILKKGFSGLTKLIEGTVQNVDLSEFKKLKENDILFIDSSHVLKIGNDVQYEYLEILPRLNGGVIVHTHDIFLPAEYPKAWVLKDHLFWTEQYLLQAFLSFNSMFEILWGGSYMHLRHPEKLEEAFNSYNRTSVWPGSFWMKKHKEVRT